MATPTADALTLDVLDEMRRKISESMLVPREFLPRPPQIRTGSIPFGDAVSPFGGMKIVASNHWPREYVGDEVYPFRPHRFWRWLSRLILRRDCRSTLERGYPIMRDGPMLSVGGTIYCSHRQYRELKNAIARQ